LANTAGFDSLQRHGTSHCRSMNDPEVRAASYSTRVERLSLRGKCCYSLQFTNHILSRAKIRNLPLPLAWRFSTDIRLP